MARDAQEDITPLLVRVRQGDPGASERVTETIYKPLHRIARRFMDSERTDHTLTPTALLHEVLLRLFRSDAFAKSANGTYLMAAAVQAMRRVLIEHERGRQREKRGGSLQRRPLSMDLEDPDSLDRVALADDLNALARVHVRASHVVTLRFFGGLTVTETARHLGVSTASVEGDWRFARAWLRRRLGRSSS
jgi:RNA polymerase sigma factor (TIGR02999 family)